MKGLYNKVTIINLSIYFHLTEYQLCCGPVIFYVLLYLVTRCPINERMLKLYSLSVAIAGTTSGYVINLLKQIH